MALDITQYQLYKKILDSRNIFNAIFCMESYIFDKGLLNIEEPVKLLDEFGKVIDVIAKNDLELYYALTDKHNVELIEKVINVCQQKLQWIFSANENLFDAKVYFKLKNYDDEILKFRPLHTARLTDLICIVSILNCLMFEDNYKEGKRNLSDLSKLVPHNFYGNIPSTNVQYLFHKWQTKYKEYTENVIEHCRAYQSNHNYLTEVSLDIKNFFPSISLKLLYNYIIEKLSSTYKNDLPALKMAVTKLLFFKLDEDNIEPWKDCYYPKDFETTRGGLYMNCGIPQGLPQSYFFGNLCMIEVKNCLMKTKCFNGDAYFYVDDSVIYVQAELDERSFKERIDALNADLFNWCNKAEQEKSDIDYFVPKTYLNFHAKLNYQIKFHEEGKSVFTPIDTTYNQFGPILNLTRETSISSKLSWNLDEIDDQVSLGKLEALDKVISREIEEQKKKANENTGAKQKNQVSSRLKLLRRFKKFFLYRNRLLKIREEGGPNEALLNSFKERFLEKVNNLADWFEQNDEDIFQSEYRLLIQKNSKEESQRLSKCIEAFEKTALKLGNKGDEKRYKYLFFAKDANSAVVMKSLSQDIYSSLIRWAKENFSGFKSLNSEKQMEKFRAFMTEKSAMGIYGMKDSGYNGKDFTEFVMKTLPENLYQDIKKYVNYKDVYICPNGIPTHENLPTAPQKEFNILFLSNMIKEKGVWDLVEACAILQKKGKPIKCHFVGKWSNITEDRFKDVINKQNLKECVFAHGAKYDNEKDAFLQKADIFVFPTYYDNECFPLVLLEAMEQSLPCISTNEGGIPGIIEEGKTGFIVEKHSPQQLAEKIEYLIDHPMICAEMGKAGKEKFQREFTLEKFENRMKDILKECIASYKK